MAAALVCVAGLALAAGSADRPLTDADAQVLQGPLRLYIDAQVHTWMPRGRTLFDVEATVRRKLAAVEVATVRDRTEPHELTLRLDYREERGKEYGIEHYGTDIACRVRLEHERLGLLLDLAIREAAPEEDTGTPPYLETLARIEANPYFYLIGDLVRGRVVSRLDQTGALVQGLERLVDGDPARLDHPQDGHTMAPTEVVYLGQAEENAVRELGRLKERRAVPALDRLLHHQDNRLRLAAVEALRAIPGQEAREALERAAGPNQATEVRAAARAALAARP